MPAVLTAVSLIQSALSIIGSFKGSPQGARVTGYVQDAAQVVAVLTPLVTQYADGHEVTADDVRRALAGKDSALAEFDALIAEKDKEQL